MISFVKNLIGKLLLPFILVFVAGYVFKLYKSNRAERSFTLSFENIDGLNKGAPVYALGTIVGKVVGTFPIRNERKIGVNIMITKDDFPLPGKGTSVAIVPSLHRTGSKVIEIKNIKLSKEGQLKVEEPKLHDHIFALMLDVLQITKDFAVASIKMITSPQSKKYAKDAQRTIKDITTSIEFGTVKDDLKVQLSKANQMIEGAESKGGIIGYKEKRALMNQVKAARNTLESLSGATDYYKGQDFPNDEIDTFKKKSKVF